MVSSTGPDPLGMSHLGESKLRMRHEILRECPWSLLGVSGDVSGLLKALCLPNKAKSRSAAYLGVDFLVSSVVQ